MSPRAALSVKSTFALLDVKVGRSQLYKHFKNAPRLGPCPPELRIPVTITGYIDGPWGSDDGTSREFSVTVQSVKTKKPR
jgi:hypothetical protein